MVSIGSGVVHARSYKIKVTVLSPSESEGVTVCEAGTYAIFMICLCRALGHSWSEEDFVSIKQDNLSTIWLQSHDGVFGRNKHILARDNYVKELVGEGIVKVSHCDTEFLNADMQTKVVAPVQQSRLMQKSDMVYIGGRLEDNEEGNRKNNKELRVKKRII